MVKTTQEYVDGAAARFAAENAGDDTVALDAIQFVVVWKSGVKEDCCGTCRDIAADNDDVEDIIPVMTARLGTCAWCECGAADLFAD